MNIFGMSFISVVLMISMNNIFAHPSAYKSTYISKKGQSLIPLSGKVSVVQDTSISNQLILAAEPPGGMQAFMRWIGQNYRYPRQAIDEGVSGTLLVQFMVEVDGSLSNITVVRDLGHGTGIEAIRLLKKSSKWKPGTADGKPVRSRFDLPIMLFID